MHQEGVEPPTYGSEDREGLVVTSCVFNTLRHISNLGCTNGCTTCCESLKLDGTRLQADRDLARVNAAWLKLPGPLKAAILAIIDSQSPQ